MFVSIDDHIFCCTICVSYFAAGLTPTPPPSPRQWRAIRQHMYELRQFACFPAKQIYCCSKTLTHFGGESRLE